jgi:hypothetical protein
LASLLLFASDNIATTKMAMQTCVLIDLDGGKARASWRQDQPAWQKNSHALQIAFASVLATADVSSDNATRSLKITIPSTQ